MLNIEINTVDFAYGFIMGVLAVLTDRFIWLLYIQHKANKNKRNDNHDTKK